MKKNIKSKILSVVIIILSFVLIYYIFNNKKVTNECNKEKIISMVSETRSNLGNFSKVEKSFPDMSTDGSNAIYYYDKNNKLVLVDTASFVSLARFFTSYYINNGQIYYINSVTDEWDLKKLHGEHGELSSTEGKYVVGKSTREGYIIKNKTLCDYIAEKPRTASVAVTASDPEKDAEGLIKIYTEIINSVKEKDTKFKK